MRFAVSPILRLKTYGLFQSDYPGFGSYGAACKRSSSFLIRGYTIQSKPQAGKKNNAFKDDYEKSQCETGHGWPGMVVDHGGSKEDSRLDGARDLN